MEEIGEVEVVNTQNDTVAVVNDTLEISIFPDPSPVLSSFPNYDFIPQARTAWGGIPKSTIWFAGCDGVGKHSLISQLSDPRWALGAPALSETSFQVGRENFRIAMLGDQNLVDARYEQPSILVDCYVLVYAACSRNSFEEVKQIRKDIQLLKDNATFALIGNKTDLKEEREVSYEEGKQLAESFSCVGFIETSVTNPKEIDKLQKLLTGLANAAIKKEGGMIRSITHKRQECACTLI